MSRETELIRREFLARQEFLVGTVIGEPRPTRFDGVAPGAGVLLVCDVDIGSNNPLLNVPIKSAGDGSHFYAGLTNTVLLRRNLLGRFQVVGPGDRANGFNETIEYNAVAKDIAVQTTGGFEVVVDAFEEYQGDNAMKGNPDITFSNEAGNDTLARDAGSFLDDGLAATDSIIITGSPLNSQTITITIAGALQLEFSGNPFVDEGPLDGIRIGLAATSRWNDGVLTFPSRRIENAAGFTIIPS